MNDTAKFGTPEDNGKLQLHAYHQAIRLYNADDEEDNPVFLAVYLDKNVERVSVKKEKIETRFLIQKSDYARGAENADLTANLNVSSSRMDVVRAYSTSQKDPLLDDNGFNYQEWVVHHGKKRERTPVMLHLTEAAKARLRGQIVDTLLALLALSENNAFDGDDDDVDTDELHVEAVDGGKVYEVWMAYGENGYREVKETVSMKR